MTTVVALLAGGYLLGRVRPVRRVSRWNRRRLALSVRGSRGRQVHAALFTVMHPLEAFTIVRARPPEPLRVVG